MVDNFIGVTIRDAHDRDLSAIETLLRTVGLPVLGVRDHMKHFLVLVDDSHLIGTVGLEIYHGGALLRSLAVTAAHQGKGHGKRLCQAIIAEARRQNVSVLYLLTETAADFFESLGFETISRDVVHDSVKASSEFQLCACESAVCMRLGLSEA
ncbi:MAG: arsenic resistance N-acetyltransferase ArsN2 [Candidatus Krumholzibacteria bacterium]|nr:arsenic resistance N-acetyltransferase ArsN2 [Candidatus Krumholzibacteria bacterium]